MNTLRLDGAQTTIVFAWANGAPHIAYHGGQLAADTDLDALVRSQTRSLAQATLDVVEPVSLHPENSRGWLGHPALIGHSPDNGRAARWAGQFEFRGVQKTDDEGGGAVFRLHDEARALTLEIDCRIDPQTDVASFWTRLENSGDTPFYVDWLAATTMAPPQHLSHLRTFHGRWCAEFQMQSRPLPMGLTSLENRRGRTSHESFPGLIVSQSTTDEEHGECLGLHMGWSGNYRVLTERLSSGDVQVQMGVLFVGAEAVLGAGESLQTPVLYVAHSDRGLNAMSQKFHHYARQRLIRFPASQPDSTTNDQTVARPVTVNTWEALYFEHDMGALKKLVDAAADIGAERFVLDDGWFKGRNDDTSSLGDWYPDPVKYPDGLRPLADYVRSRGLQFGLWVEPEMVNPDSELLRKHPDWALGLDDYPTVTGRNQLVIDLSNADVVAWLYERLESLVESNEIAYLKWDMNREYVTPADVDGHASAWRQTEALYALFDRLLARFPALEIESCASGGARIDFGILSRCHRFWTSDSNDPVERMRIQSGYSYFFPAEVMGAHIGPRWSHTTGRGLHTGLRALAASTGHLGIEADLTAIDDEERSVIRDAVARYKNDRHIWHGGRLSRVETVDPSLFGNLAITMDARQARLVMMQTDRPRSSQSPRVFVPGLLADRRYRVALSYQSEMVKEANRSFDNPLASDGYIASGAVLAQAGIALPTLYAQTGLAIAMDMVE